MKTLTTENTVNLLWTGGWDSTFRLLALVLTDRETVIQPVYVIDTGRASTIREIDTMRKVREMLRERDPDAARRIRPSFVILLSDIGKDETLYARFIELKKRGHLGSQYEWLARLAKQLGIEDLELCVEAGGAADRMVKPYMEKTAEGYWKLKPEYSGTEFSLFEAFRFPLIDWSKQDMENFAARHGFLDILEHTWFCFRPINGKPCGVCNPCLLVGKQLRRRLPGSTRLRQKVWPALRFAKKVLSGR